MSHQDRGVKRTVGIAREESPLDRVWRLSQFLRRMGVRREETGADGERVRKVVGRPR
ncbi:MAG: hypothetical protein ABIK09_19440 [Pseudomonadota bacterium]